MRSRIPIAAVVLVGVGLLVAAVLLSGDRDEKPSADVVAVASQPTAPKRARLTTATDSRAAASTEHVIAGRVTHLPPGAAAHVEARRVDDCPARAHVTDVFEDFAPPPEAAPALAAAPTTADGAFELKIATSGTYLVTAKLDGGGESSRRVEVPDVLPRVDVDIPAPSAGNTLRGRVVRADGAPLRGWVRLFEYDVMHDEVTVRTGVPGEDGRFAFRGVVGVTCSVEAGVAGEELVTTDDLTLPHTDDVTLTLGDGPVRRGRVVADADGAPIAGARVTVSASGEGTSARRLTKTDATGEFAVAAVSVDSVVASAPGFGTTFERAPGDRVVVRLRRCGAITGRVLRSSDGSPVEGAVVRTSSQQDWWTSPSPVTSGADGTFRVEDAAPGECDVFVLGGGWASVALATWSEGNYDEKQDDPFAVDVAPGGIATCELRVEATGRIEGVAVGPTGDPIRGAAVRLDGKHDGTKGPKWDVSSTAWTGADGTFAFDGVPGGAGCGIDALSPGLPLAHGYAAPATAETSRVELRFAAPQRIEVTVLSAATGAPVPNAEVDVSTDAGGGLGSTGPDGHCVFTDAPQGRPMVGARAFGFFDDERTAALTPAKRDPSDPHLWRAEIRLRPALGVSGRLLRGDGTSAAYESISVELSPENERAEFFEKQEIETAADGSFRFANVPAGTYALSARGRTLLAPVVAGGPDVIVRLPDAPDAQQRGPAFTLRFTGADGVTIPSGRVELLCAKCYSGESFEGGALSLSKAKFAGSELRIAVSAPTADDGRLLPLGTTIVVLHDPLPDSIDVVLPPERVATGRVIGPDGRGVAGARLHAQFAQTGFLNEVASCVSSDDGSFALHQLGENEFWLDVEPPRDFLPTAVFAVRGGQRDVVVNVAAAAVGVVTVLDWDGMPVRGALIDVRATKPAPSPDPRNADPGLLAHVVTGADGTARVNGIVPGTECAIVVTGPANRDDLADWRTSTWTPHDVEVKLERAFAIRGVVVDESGKGVPHATIWIAIESGKPGEIRSDDAGRFVIPRLRRSETRRLCGGDSYAYIVPSAAKWTTVTAGDADVRLTARKSQ